ncbi:MAG TPA: aminotransferase class V-fold PLP-dependent enzyme [Phycisphaerales bacterium]|nr:aminotransferase class V-fold PLP-dependent enzyme [Phycisphaerales bacterium]
MSQNDPTIARRPAAQARRLYLDNAATSFPKPPAVAQAMAGYMTELGAPARGLYAEARQGAEILRLCRERLCELFHAPRAPDGGRGEQNVVFTLNTTDALNLAIRGSLVHARARSRTPVGVITSDAEHNSVLRPLARLEREGVCRWMRVAVDPRTGLLNPDDVIDAARALTLSGVVPALVGINHASNVTGAVQDIDAIGRGLRDLTQGRTLFLIDVAQSLGHIDVNVEAACVDLLAFPGHKGLLGPQGTGGLWIRPGVERQVDTVREGGTGNRSEDPEHPEIMPEKFEAGSHNAVGIAGLSEGVAWLLEQGVDRIRAHELELTRRVLARFDTQSGRGDAESGGELAGLRLLGLAPASSRVGVFCFTHEQFEPAELSMLLETEFGILSRPGLHCAPLVHRAMGTFDPDRGITGGACRISFGPFVTPDDVDYALEALAKVCQSAAAQR